VVLMAGLLYSSAACSLLHRPMAESSITVGIGGEEDIKEFMDRREAARRASLVSRDYDLHDLIDMAARTRLANDEQEAKSLLTDILLQAEGPYSVRGADSHEWSGGVLTVLAAPGQHDEIAASARVLREQGFEQVMRLEIRFVWATESEVESIGEWLVSSIDAPGNDDPRRNHEPSDSAGHPHSGATPIGLRARRFSEQESRVHYQVLDEDQAARLSELVMGDRRGSSSSLPKITACSGREMVAADCTEKPFLAGMENGRPELRMISEGMVIHSKALPLGDGRLRLDCRTTISGVVDSNLDFDFEISDDDAPNGISSVRLCNTPEVGTLVIEGAVEMRAGQTLLISGLRTVSEGKDKPLQSLMLMLTPRQPFATETTKPM